MLKHSLVSGLSSKNKFLVLGHENYVKVDIKFSALLRFCLIFKLFENYFAPNCSL